MPKRYPSGLVWFRRDLRTEDNAALHHALQECEHVYGAFIFDEPILRPLPRADRRVEFIHACVQELGSKFPDLIVRHADAATQIARIARELRVDAVFANRDYEPGAISRDANVRMQLTRARVAFHQFKDQVVFEGPEVLTGAGTPYTVFTPYRKAWLARLERDGAHPFDSAALLAKRGEPTSPAEIPTLQSLGFRPTNVFETGVLAGESGGQLTLSQFLERLARYGETRDYPSLDSTSRLGMHLRFGTVSVRQLVRMAQHRAAQGDAGAATWLSELAWRDFFFQILAHFPHVVDGCFRAEYDALEWEAGAHADELFAAWCEGRTGYPIVDAAMAQINATGFMHNRLRMVAASFLVKDLGIDWRRGERWFAEKLNDYDLAANNGNWQWAASTGCDAQPWFRIFNPSLQQQRFDRDGKFIAHWIGGRPVVPPVVNHEEARQRTLRRYKAVRRART